MNAALKSPLWATAPFWAKGKKKLDKASEWEERRADHDRLETLRALLLRLPIDKYLEQKASLDNLKDKRKGKLSEEDQALMSYCKKKIAEHHALAKERRDLETKLNIHRQPEFGE